MAGHLSHLPWTLWSLTSLLSTQNAIPSGQRLYFLDQRLSIPLGQRSSFFRPTPTGRFGIP